jgi:thiamine-monophosphate kinase
MKLAEIGQFGMLDKISTFIAENHDNRWQSWRKLIAGVGDDCAVWKGDLSNQYAKVDCQVQGIHFNLDIISWEDLGWKSLAVNLSDIAAMGGIPSYALVSLGLPMDTEVDNVMALYRGLLDLSNRCQMAVVGGNLSGSPVIFIDVHVIGKAGNPQGNYLSRYTAQPGDLIGVTGWLGSAAAGFKMLQHKMEAVNSARVLIQAFSRPEPRLSEGRLLIDNGVKTGMDISDGLLSDLGHICRASQVGAVIFLEQLPIHPEVTRRFAADSTEMALSGGEDYQLLFTAKPEIIKKVCKLSDYPINIIGEIRPGPQPSIIVLDQNQHEYKPQHTGWDHFKR